MKSKKTVSYLLLLVVLLSGLAVFTHRSLQPPQAAELWANNAVSSLASGITNVATSITVVNGASFPSPTGSDYFWATLDNGTTREIVKVTARSTHVMTVTRAQQGTTGTAFSAGTRFELRVTKQTLEDLQASAGAPTNATYITQTANGSLSAEQALSGLSTGLAVVTTGTGVISTVAAPSGAVVGTTDTQTLTNKTVTTPIATSYTVATLPAAGTAGRVAVVTDGAAAGDCTSGGGSSLALCRDSGAAWIPIGDGASGGSGDATHTAVYGSRPSPSNAGDLFFPSDSFYAERDTGAAWTPWGPIFAMTPPVSGDFAWVNQGSATVTTTNGGIHLYSPGSATVNLRIRKKAITAPYTVTAYVMVSFDDVSSSPLGGVCFREAATGEIVTFGLAWISNKFSWHIGKYTNETTWAGVNPYYTANPLAATIGPGVWLRMVDDNTNRICSYSIDGQNFRQLHSITRTDFLTADEVGFFVEAGASTSQQPRLTLLSWAQ